MRRTGHFATALSLGTLVLGAAVLGAVASCTTGTSSTPTPPVSGVVVSAGSIIPPGKCGTGAGQLSRYLVVLHDADKGNALVTFGLYPCYADAYFVSLTSVHYTIDAYALSADMEAAAYTGVDPSFQPRLGPCDAGAPADGGAADAGEAGADSGADAAADSGAVDSGAADSGVADSGPSDAAADAGDASADSGADAGVPLCPTSFANRDVISAYARAGNLTGLLTFPAASRAQCTATQVVDTQGNILQLQVVAACVGSGADAAASD